MLLKITSVNQTIYKQLRGYLDGAMKNYHERVNNGEAKNKQIRHV